MIFPSTTTLGNEEVNRRVTAAFEATVEGPQCRRRPAEVPGRRRAEEHRHRCRQGQYRRLDRQSLFESRKNVVGAFGANGFVTPALGDAVSQLKLNDKVCAFGFDLGPKHRGRKGSLRDLGMAVVVQRMVEPDVSGVLFTVDPAKGRRDRMIVEAVLGLGEGVVSGQLTPDHYALARDGRVKRTRVAPQPYAIVHDPAGGVREEALPAERGAAQKLTEAQLARLAGVGRELEERLGGPQDIEWALQGDELFILQSRPVTA